MIVTPVSFVWTSFLVLSAKSSSGMLVVVVMNMSPFGKTAVASGRTRVSSDSCFSADFWKVSEWDPTVMTTVRETSRR